MFKQGQVRPIPLISSLVAQLGLKESTRQESGSEPGPPVVYKCFSAKNPTGWEVVMATKWWEKQGRSFPLVYLSQKIWKKVPIINNHGDHTRKFKDRVSLLQLFKLIVGFHELHASKPEQMLCRHVDGSCSQSFGVRDMKRICVKTWQKKC